MGWWIWVIRSISASIMVKTNLREAIAISTALNHSGHRLNGGLQNSRAFPDIRFIYTSKNMNSHLIIERKISMIKYSLC